MAVQAQFLSHGFPHDLQAMRALENATSGSVFLDEPGGSLPVVVGNTMFSDPRSELTCNNNNSCCFMPRKRARVTAEGGFVESQRVVLPPVPQTFVSGDVQSRAVESGVATTSGRSANAALLSHGLLSQFYHQSVEIDALIRFETERMRAGLEDARRRHLRSVVAAVERAASGRLRAAEAELERARCRNAELEEKVRQMSAEGQAWLGVAKSHEAVAAGLRVTLDQLLQPPCGGTAAGEGDAEDAQSCCYEAPADAAGAVAKPAATCKACGERDACVLLLPCRHLCLCQNCEAAVDACPVCAAMKNASLHVLLS